MLPQPQTKWTLLVSQLFFGTEVSRFSYNLSLSDTVEARKIFDDISSELKNLERDLDNAQQSIERLSEGFGPDAEWKKLEGTCIEKEQGE
jgi:hypothetical protein